MRTVIRTVGQIVVLAALAIGLGLGINTARGRDQIHLHRDYFHKDPNAGAETKPTTTRSVGSQPATASASAPTHPYHEVTLEQAVEIFSDPKVAYGLYRFVDARADAPFEAGHIPGAIQCDYYRSDYYLPEVIPRVLGAEKIVVYCNGGDCEDSLMVCSELMTNNVPPSTIYLFKGGWEEWHQSGQPVETGPEEREPKEQ